MKRAGLALAHNVLKVMRVPAVQRMHEGECLAVVAASAVNSTGAFRFEI